ncbi:hypothetical protein PTKIN_Ptkin09bG0276100 [Pterospermum kingtungense]
MADQGPEENKPFRGQVPTNGETTFRIVGRFCSVNPDDESDETKASTGRYQNNAEGPAENKSFTGQVPANGETTFRIVGCFGSVNPDDEPDETKASTDRNQNNAEGQPSKGETKIRLVGRFGNIEVDDELDKAEAEAEESLSLTHDTDKKQNNAEGLIRCLMENKKQDQSLEDGIEELDLSPYKQLWKAIVREDWKEVRKELDLKPLALTSPISEFYETILHILVIYEKALPLVRELVDKIDPDSLGETDYQRDTALSIAAYAGNKKAAKMMAMKNPDLLRRVNYSGDSPFHAAARFGHEDTFHCLLTVAQTTEMDDQSFFFGDCGAKIVRYLISANLYGLALDLLNCYPTLGREKLRHRKRILMELAEKPLGFESGTKFGLWERLIYKAISVTKEVTIPSMESKHDDLRIDIVDRDEENCTKEEFFAKCRQQAYFIIGLFCNFLT